MKQGKIIEILLSLQEHVLKIKDDVSGIKGDIAGLKDDVSGLKTDVAEIKEKMLTKAEFYIVTDALSLTLKNFTRGQVSPTRQRVKKLERAVFKK